MNELPNTVMHQHNINDLFIQNLNENYKQEKEEKQQCVDSHPQYEDEEMPNLTSVETHSHKRKNGTSEENKQPSELKKANKSVYNTKESRLTTSEWQEIQIKLDQQINYAKTEGECDTWKDDKATHIIRKNGEQYMRNRLLYYLHNNTISSGSMIKSICCTTGCADKRHLYEFPSSKMDWEERRHYLLKIIKANVTIDSETECWLWNLGKDKDGYGLVGFIGLSHRVHRTVYQLHHGLNSIPEGQEILHDHGPKGKCKGKHCCNEDHLKPGTSHENSNDKVLAGTVLVGEQHPMASISNEVAQKIKDSKGNGKTQSERASDYGVLLHVVKHIDCGQSWAHLPRNGEITNPNNKDKQNKRAQENRKLRKVDGFTPDEYKRAMENMSKRVFKEECYEIIDHKEGEVIHPCSLILKTKGKPKSHVRTGIGSTERFAHITVWEYYYNNGKLKPEKDEKGEILDVRHLCPSHQYATCIEKTHLKLGTRQQNNLDKLYWADGKNFKLDYWQAGEIRQKKQSGATAMELSIDYEVTVGTIKDVVAGRKWKEIA